MYPSYVVRRGPSSGCRAMRHAPHQLRQMHHGPGFFPPAPFFGGLAARGHPFFGPGPRGRQDVFDHFDDFVNRSFEGLFSGADRQVSRSNNLVWQPRFDVREVDNAYELRGELPGVEAKDLEVEFTNENTLVIRGQTQSQRTQDTPQAQTAQAAAETPAAAADSVHPAADAGNVATAKDSDAASVHSNDSYVRPSVEDEADAERRESVGTAAETTTDAPGAATPNTNDSVAAAVQDQQVNQQSEQPQSRYWVSERSTGSFLRTFEFPGRIDADAVSASLQNGILDIVVPKAKAPETRKVNVA